MTNVFHYLMTRYNQVNHIFMSAVQNENSCEEKFNFENYFRSCYLCFTRLGWNAKKLQKFLT